MFETTIANIQLFLITTGLAWSVITGDVKQVIQTLSVTPDSPVVVAADIAQKKVDTASIVLGVSTSQSVRHATIDSPFVAQAINGTRIQSQEKKPRAFILPHHLVGGRLIADAYARASEFDIDTIIIIGPNHFDTGSSWIMTTDVTWDTPYGRVEADSDVITKLQKVLPLSIESEFVSKEHSVSSQMPFIAEYLPHAKVIPIVLSGHTKPEELEQLKKTISSIIDNETLLIGSVDFSHYLQAVEAEKKDKETRSLLEAGNMEKILTLGNNNLDSPKTLSVVYDIMKKDKRQMQILDNTHAGHILPHSLEPVTSYFEIVWY